MPDRHTDAAAAAAPGAGDDTLREVLAETIEALRGTVIDDRVFHVLKWHPPVIADALLPRIREHIAAAVQAERERAEQERVRPLLPAEHIAYTVSKSQIGRGENPPYNTTAALLLAVERLTGMDRQEVADA